MGILDIVCDCAGVLVVIDARRTAGEMGIYVANVPDYGVEEVADSAINHLLNIMRHTVQASLQANQVLCRSTLMKSIGSIIPLP